MTMGGCDNYQILNDPKRKPSYINSKLVLNLIVVMGRPPFYRTSNELKQHFSNIERTRTCSSISDRTLTPYFWIRTIEH